VTTLTKPAPRWAGKETGFGHARNPRALAAKVPRQHLPSPECPAGGHPERSECLATRSSHASRRTPSPWHAFAPQSRIHALAIKGHVQMVGVLRVRQPIRERMALALRMTLDSLGNRPSKLANPIPVRSHLISRKNHKNFEVSNRCLCRSHSNGVISGALVLVPNLDFFLGSARSFPGFRFTNNADSAVSQLRAGFPAGRRSSHLVVRVLYTISAVWLGTLCFCFLRHAGAGRSTRSPPFRPPSQPTRLVFVLFAIARWPV